MAKKKEGDDSKELAAAVRSLAKQVPARSETARLRDIFEDIEVVLQSGVQRDVVLATLHAKGFTMTANSFKSALQRIRKERSSN